MKVKHYLLIFVLLMIGSTVFAISPKIESFAVYNYSSNEVIINVEFWEGEGMREAQYSYSWLQNVCGMDLVIKDFLSAAHRNVLRPKNDTLNIIQYFPGVPLNESASAYSKMDNIPFMEKMRAIFKKLEIVCEATLHTARRVITLDNLEDHVVKKMILGGGTACYILEIFDYDFEGKRASEW